MDKSLELLIERHNICELLYRYGSSLDDRNWARLASCFTPDAVALYGAELGQQDGYAAIERACRSALEPLDSSQHIITNPEIEIEGETARSRCYLHAQHTKKGKLGGDNLTIGAMYLDDIVRTPEGWRIKKRELRFIWQEGNSAVLWG